MGNYFCFQGLYNHFFVEQSIIGSTIDVTITSIFPDSMLECLINSKHKKIIKISGLKEDEKNFIHLKDIFSDRELIHCQLLVNEERETLLIGTLYIKNGSKFINILDRLLEYDTFELHSSITLNNNLELSISVVRDPEIVTNPMKVSVEVEQEDSVMRKELEPIKIIEHAF